MKIIKLSFGLIFFSLTSLALFAQDSQKLLKQALKYEENKDYSRAIPFFREVLMYDNLVDAKKGLANCYRNLKDYPSAEYWYKVMLNINPGEPEYLFHYANMLKNNGDCESDKKYFKEYAKFDEKGLDFIKSCDDLSDYKKDEDKYLTYKVSVNSKNAEFGPVYYEDGIVYTGGGLSSSFGGYYTDLFFTKPIGQYEYKAPVKLKGKVNSDYHDGPVSFNAFGDEIWVTRTGNETIKDKKSKEMKRNLKIVKLTMKNDKWDDETEFKHNNPNYSVAHPSLSDNGKTLFFISDMPGGMGGTDIYVSYLQNGSWSEPQNLGPTINTLGNELFPFTHIDGTLYFSSDGHAGLGGLDIFYSTFLGDSWKKPTNYGSPVNSTGDDITFITSLDNSTGYFASNRYGGKGSDDLYYFERKDRIIAETAPAVADEPLDDVDVSLSNGISINEQLGINKIKFEYKKSNLKSETYQELLKVVQYLSDYPDSKILIESHTDSRELVQTNMQISNERAENIKEILLGTGIEKNRVEAQGFGESLLVNDCADGIKCSDNKHEQNDRIEFKLLNAFGEEEKFGDEPEDSEFLNLGSSKKKSGKDNESLQILKKQHKKEKTDAKKLAKEEKAAKKAQAAADKLANPEKEKEEKPKKEKKEKKEKPLKEKKEKKEKPVKKEKDKKKRTKDNDLLTPEEKKQQKAEKKKNNVLTKPKPVKETEEETFKPMSVPVFSVSDQKQGITYKIHIGPQRDLSIEDQTYIQDLKIPSIIQQKGKKELLILGAFTSIKDSEKVLNYLEHNGINKSKIIVYQDGVATKASIKELKEKGLR